MQELMSRHKTTTFSPRDCLKTILHQRWSKTCSGREERRALIRTPVIEGVNSDTRPPAKPRRKRKANATTNNNTPAANTTNLAMNKEANPNHSPTPTKKRSPASTAYSQPNQGPLTNNTPGVRPRVAMRSNAHAHLFRT
jgi:hypothetical protein